MLEVRLGKRGACSLRVEKAADAYQRGRDEDKGPDVQDEQLLTLKSDYCRLFYPFSPLPLGMRRLVQ